MQVRYTLKHIFLLCLMTSIIAFIFLTSLQHDIIFPPMLPVVSFNKPPNLAQLFKYEPFQDPNLLGNMSGFQILIDSNVCESEENIDILFVVTPHPTRRHLRDVFREFFAKPSSNSPDMVFKTILHLQDELEQFRLEEESAEYGDIVQGNFVDSYYNITLRDLMGLRWAWQKCPQTRYVVRMDDDVAFDIRTLLETLHGCCSHLLPFIGCYRIVYNNPVIRAGWHSISPAEFSGSVYENHCNGWLYAMTPSMAYRLDAAAQRVKMLWLTDVYIAGSLVKELGVKHVFLDLQSTEDNKQFRRMLASGKQTYSFGPTLANVTFSRQMFQFYADQSRNKSWVW